MQLDDAIKGLLKTRGALRTTEGIQDPQYLSENMQRLTQYTAAVEEHLAELEKVQDDTELRAFNDFIKQGKSVNQAEILAKKEAGSYRGEIARLSRLVRSSWSVIDVARSRINHLQAEYQQGGKLT